MLLKVIPFESLGTVSYSLSIVTMAVSLAISKIFSVKEWRDPENQVRGRSRSLKMAPFDRPYVTFYWSAIPTQQSSDGPAHDIMLAMPEWFRWHQCDMPITFRCRATTVSRQ